MTKPPQPPAFINATPEIKAFIEGLSPEDYLSKIINEAKRKLRENMFVGEPVEKKKFPKCYIQKHSINNLHHLDLDRKRRLTYTLITNDQGVGVVILEIFQTHKEYDRRMGYG